MINVLRLHFSKSKFAKDSFWAVFGNAVGNGVFLIAGIIIARLLGKDVYGEYGFVKTTMFYIATFASFGMYSTSTKYLAEYISTKREYVKSVVRGCLWIAVIFSGIMAVLLLFFSNQLANYLDHPQLSTPLRYLSIIIVLKAFNQTQLGVLGGLKQYKATSHTNIISGLTMLVCGISLTYWFGLNGALLALLSSQLVQAVCNHLYIRKVVHSITEPQLSKPFIKELVVFSFPVAIQCAIKPLGTWTYTFLITKMSTLGQLGIYSAAIQWNAIILMVPTLLYNVILSHLSDYEEASKEQNALIKKVLALNFVCAFAIFVVVYVFSPFISSFYGSTFDGLIDVLRVIVFATIFDCLSGVMVAVLISNRKRWQSLSIVITKFVVSIPILYYVLNINEGHNAALYMAEITVLTSVLAFVMQVIYFRHNRKRHRINKLSSVC